MGFVPLSEADELDNQLVKPANSRANIWPHDLFGLK
jgi:hypothetical protein